MTTLAQMMDEVHLLLLGGGSADHEQITALTSSPTSGAASFTVSDGTMVSTGLIEVDDELMWCTSVATNTVNVINRGMYGSTAAAHTSGTSFVRNSPRFPRALIKKALNDALLATYPDLYAVASTTITSTAGVIEYQLPTATEDVLDLHYDLNDTSEYWYPVRVWKFNPNANTTAFPNGKSVSIMDAILAGRTINVLYKKKPTVLTSSDDITVSGLRESAKECLVYGACARLAGYASAGESTSPAAAGQWMNPERGDGILTLSRYYYGLHLQAKQDEQRRLNDAYPPRIHFTR